MRADLLWEHFETLVKTPEDADALSKTIIQLGMSGRLLPQDPTDVPASDMLKRISATRQRLVETGQARKSKPLPAVAGEEIPYVLPDSWQWVRLGDIANYAGSKNAGPEDVSEATWVLYLEDIEKYTSRLLQRVRFDQRPFTSSKRTFREGDVLYGKLRPYLDKVLIADDDGVCSTEIMPVSIYSDLDPHYLRYAMKRPDFIGYVTRKSYGTKMPRLGITDARMALIPLPPRAEQERIVARLDELLARTRKLSTELQSADDLLEPAARASFQALVEAPNRAARREAWQRIQDGFEALTSDPPTINALKQTILDLAVRGLLVPQDPRDEPAGVLLDRVCQEKQHLAERGEIRKPRSLPAVSSANVPYPLPSTWRWCRLGDTSLDIHYGYTASADASRREYRFLRITDIQDNTVIWDSVPGCHIDPDVASRYLLRRNDILIARTGGTIGKTYLVKDPPEKTVFASYLIRAIPAREVDASYLKLFLESSVYWEQLTQESKGTGQPNVNATALGLQWCLCRLSASNNESPVRPAS